MTTHNTAAKNPRHGGRFVFPDPPEPEERGPDDVTSFDHLSINGNAYLLSKHLGNPETTLVAGEHYLAPRPVRDLTRIRYPDLLVAFNADLVAYRESNAYVVSEQGKPPDFVLEIASRDTRRIDREDKRDDYAALGIPEYWRFDEAGRFPHTRLAGDRLVDGQYQPVAIEELPDGALQGFSEILNLYIRWEQGQLRWHDPATDRHIATFDDERARADTERIRAETERARADSERARADSAEERVRELREELQRLRDA